MIEEKVYVTYHREDGKISATTREFIKPTANDDKGSSGISWSVENHSAYLVGLQFNYFFIHLLFFRSFNVLPKYLS